MRFELYLITQYQTLPRTIICSQNVTGESANEKHTQKNNLVPDIIAFFETEEAKREFEVWKLEQEKKFTSIQKEPNLIIGLALGQHKSAI